MAADLHARDVRVGDGRCADVQAGGGFLGQDRGAPPVEGERVECDVGRVEVQEHPVGFTGGGDVVDQAVGDPVELQPARGVAGQGQVADIDLVLARHRHPVGVVAGGGDTDDRAVGDRAHDEHPVGAVAVGLDPDSTVA